MNAKTYSDVQAAIDRLAVALKRAAENQESPPAVDFDVSWLDVTTTESRGRCFEPVIRFTVTRTETVNFDDL